MSLNIERCAIVTLNVIKNSVLSEISSTKILSEVVTFKYQIVAVCANSDTRAARWTALGEMSC